MQMTRARRLLARVALFAAAGALLAGCAGSRLGGGTPNWREQGLASWYGPDFHGRRTASGERYNMYAMTAAHKTLPLGTQLLVTSQQTGRRVRVRVNDRGPFVAGRVVDLSLAAARSLGSAGSGVVPVTLEAVLPASAFANVNAVKRPGTSPGGQSQPQAAPRARAPSSPPPLRGAFAVQVGSFSLESNARALAARLPAPRGAVSVLPFEDNRGTWWRVRVGGYTNELDAGTAALAYTESGLPSLVVRED
jgi:rare lipoprotein A